MFRRKNKELDYIRMLSNNQREITEIIAKQQDVIKRLEKNVQALHDQLSKKEGM